MTRCIEHYEVVEAEPQFYTDVVSGETFVTIRRFRVHFDGNKNYATGSFDSHDEAEAFGRRWLTLEEPEYLEDEDEE